MNPESHENVINAEAAHLREKNAMQIELARRFYGFDDDTRFAEEWIPKHSAKFRELFEREIETNPKFFEKLSEPAKREEILKRFEGELYEKDGLKNAT